MKADTQKQPLVKYGLPADEVATDPIVRRHFAVAEGEAAIGGLLLHRSVHNLSRLLRAGKV